MAGLTIVTGGTGGIGSAIADRLTEAGHTVVAGDLAVEERKATAGKGVTLVELDVTSSDSVHRAVEASLALGPLRGLVNCAGIVRNTPADDTSDADMAAVWSVNVAGTARMCRETVRHLQPGSSIVNIGSIAGSIGRLGGASLYGATKKGLESYTRSLACELAPRGIRVNAVAPGFIRVPMSKAMKAVSGGDAAVVEHIPLGRLGEPSEIAEVVEFLMSRRASYITGTVVYADGGVLAR